MHVSNWFVIFAFICWPWPCSANSCRQFFSSSIEAHYNQVYAGQESVGSEYALYKELRDANLDPLLSIKELSHKQKKILMTALLKDLEDPIPAVRDPFGRFFLLDGHHAIYLAAQLFPNINEISTRLKLLYDARLTGVSWQQFVDLSIQNHWFYTPTAASILSNPRHVHELQNNVERSSLGLFFISIEAKYGVPMKGKYFQPFIQFYLADLIRQNGIITLPIKMDFSQIPRIRKTLLASPLVINFLVEQLKSDAPQELKEFLWNLKSKHD